MSVWENPIVSVEMKYQVNLFGEERDVAEPKQNREGLRALDKRLKKQATVYFDTGRSRREESCCAIRHQS